MDATGKAPESAVAFAKEIKLELEPVTPGAQGRPTG